MTIVLDAGAFIEIERGNRGLMALLKREHLASRVPVTNGGVIGQVWRGGRDRGANVARLLPAVDVRPIDDPLGRRAGILLGAARTTDVIDAAVVLLAHDGDEIFTSDVADIVRLAEALGSDVEVISV